MRLKFLSEQVSLLFATPPRYSTDLMLFAFRMFALSSSYYQRLRDSILSLPHVSYLRRLSSVLSVHGGFEDNNHAAYLKSKSDALEPHERIVILMLDEIHVDPQTTYRGGVLHGKAENNILVEATTVQAFMICSIMSGNRDVAALIPVKNLTTEYLTDCTMKVLKLLEDCGYQVLCLISDNNRVNRNMFTNMCGGTLQPFIAHPCASDRRLYSCLTLYTC